LPDFGGFGGFGLDFSFLIVIYPPIPTLDAKIILVMIVIRLIDISMMKKNEKPDRISSAEFLL